MTVPSRSENLISIMVIYNFRPDISEIIMALECGQLRKAIFVDNSTERETGTEFVKNVIPPSIENKVLFVKNKTNVGLSKGINLGLVEARKLCADYIFILDQDAILLRGYFEEMYQNFRFVEIRDTKLCLLGPIVSNSPNNMGKSMGFRSSFSRVKTIINSGMMFSSQTIERIGIFNEELFIGSIDHEFCRRITEIGGHIYRLNKVMINQSFGKNVKGTNLFGKAMSLETRFFSYIMLGLNKTNEFQFFTPFYGAEQARLNLIDAQKFEQNKNPGLIKTIISKIYRRLIEKFGDV